MHCKQSPFIVILSGSLDHDLIYLVIIIFNRNKTHEPHELAGYKERDTTKSVPLKEFTLRPASHMRHDWLSKLHAEFYEQYNVY